MFKYNFSQSLFVNSLTLLFCASFNIYSMHTGRITDAELPAYIKKMTVEDANEYVNTEIARLRLFIQEANMDPNQPITFVQRLEALTHVNFLCIGSITYALLLVFLVYPKIDSIEASINLAKIFEKARNFDSLLQLAQHNHAIRLSLHQLHTVIVHHGRENEVPRFITAVERNVLSPYLCTIV